MSRCHQFQRQWQIIQLLETGAAPDLQDLAEVLPPPEEAGEDGAGRRWSESTLRRDLEDLAGARFPLLKVREGGTRWRFSPGFRRVAPSPFLPSELMALYYARGEFSAFQKTPFGTTFRSLLEKVEGLVPKPIRAFLDLIDEDFTPYLASLKEVSAHRQVMERLEEAAEGRRCVEILYHAPGLSRAAWHRVDPYGVWFSQGETFLMAHEHRRGKIHLFPLKEIRELRLTEDVFQLPLDLDFEPILTLGPVAPGEGLRVRAQLTGEAAERVRTWAERGAPQGLRVEESQDGPKTLRVEYIAKDFETAKTWALGWGDEALVMEPETLRKEVVKELRATLMRYFPRRRKGQAKR